MRIPRLVPVAVAATLTIGLAACGDDAGTEATGGGTAGPTAIGVSYPTANSPFWKAYLDFVEDGAQQLGVQVTAVSADENEQKQLNDVQNLISQGVQGLIITPQSTSIAASILRAAATAKIPVVITDRYPGYDPGAEGKPGYEAFIGPNDQQAGNGIATALSEAGGKNFLALGGVPGNSVAEGRQAGLDEAIAATGAKLVQYQATGETEEKGLSTSENLLQAHPKGTADAIWCYNDNLCMGAIKAAKNAGRDADFVFGGMDLTPQAISSIESGDYTVSFGGHWLMGGFGLAVLYDKINGVDPAEKIVKLDLLKVDKANVADFKAKYIDNPPKYDFKQLTKANNPSATINYEITLD